MTAQQPALAVAPKTEVIVVRSPWAWVIIFLQIVLYK